MQRALRAAGIDILFLDCPPGFSSVLREAIGASDLVLLPAGASVLDLAAVASTAEMAARAGVPFRFVLNRAVFRSRPAGRADGAGDRAGQRGGEGAVGAVAGRAGRPVRPRCPAARAPGRRGVAGVSAAPRVTCGAPGRKGGARPPPEPEVRPRAGGGGARRVGTRLPTELYARFKAYVAREGMTGEQAIVPAIERLIREA